MVNAKRQTVNTCLSDNRNAAIPAVFCLPTAVPAFSGLHTAGFLATGKYFGFKLDFVSLNLFNLKLKQRIDCSPTDLKNALYD